MNILAMVFALVLMISLLTVEKLERVKNQTIIQNEYGKYLQNEEGAEFNLRQERLYKKYPANLKVLSFKFILNKKAREESPEKAKEFRLLITDLIKNLYGHAAFYKEAELDHPHLTEDFLNAIEKAAEEAPEKSIKSIKDVARLNLDDPVLQNVLYHLLKGSIKRDRLTAMQNAKDSILEKKEWSERAYPSLLLFVTAKEEKVIPIQRTPKEVLKVIFLNDEIVEKILEKRQELADKKDESASGLFKDEFASKVREGISLDLLNFDISKGLDRTRYN